MKSGALCMFSIVLITFGSSGSKIRNRVIRSIQIPEVITNIVNHPTIETYPREIIGHGCLYGIYCGHTVQSCFRGFEKAIPHHLYQCSGLTATLVEICQGSCYQPNAMVDATCGCTVGQTYCAKTLEDMGFHNPSRDVVYNCTDANHVKVLEHCANDTKCIDRAAGPDHCGPPCALNKLYCAPELTGLPGWSSAMWFDDLYKCTADGTDVEIERRCGGTCVTSNSSMETPFCPPCVKEKIYCGHELKQLDGWSSFWKADDFLYKCNTDGTNVEMQELCFNCIPANSSATNSSCGDP